MKNIIDKQPVEHFVEPINRGLVALYVSSSMTDEEVKRFYEDEVWQLQQLRAL